MRLCHNRNRAQEILPREIPHKMIFRISGYATASTDESVYIIGGYTAGSPDRTTAIAEYKDGNWKIAGNLAQARSGHSAITSGYTTMVVGGYLSRAA